MHLGFSRSSIPISADCYKRTYICTSVPAALVQGRNISVYRERSVIPASGNGVNMVLCNICEKRPALVFVTKTDKGHSTQKRFCLLCARKAEIPQVSEYMKQMDITDEDIEQMYGSVGNDEKSEIDTASSLPEFLGRLFSKRAETENVKRVNMVLCKNCKKRPATVFITSMCGSKKQRYGLCLSCAKKEEIPQVAEYIGYMGITDEDIERMYGSVLNDENPELDSVSSMPDSIRSMFTDHL